MEITRTFKVVRITEPTGLVRWCLEDRDGAEVFRAVAMHDALTHKFMGYRTAVGDGLAINFNSIENLELILQRALGNFEFQWLNRLDRSTMDAFRRELAGYREAAEDQLAL